MEVEDDATSPEVENLLASLSSASRSADDVKALESRLGNGAKIVDLLVSRIFCFCTTPTTATVDGDDALLILKYLSESQPDKYLAITASTVRRHTEMNNADFEYSSDPLIISLIHLIGASSIDVATDAHASLLNLCRCDKDHKHSASVSKRVLAAINNLWQLLMTQDKEGRRKSSSYEMRLGALMIDICLLGGPEMTLALTVIDKLLDTAFNCPEDPLLQVSALEQVQRLVIDSQNCPMSPPRAEFLLGNVTLHRGLLVHCGLDNNQQDWGQPDQFSGGQALHLVAELCHVGVSSLKKVHEETKNTFSALCAQFHKCLLSMQPIGETDRLSYIQAVSSLVGTVASSLSTSEGVNAILNYTQLLDKWLSFYTRASQPKLKAAVMSSLSQVIEPSIWYKEDSRPIDGTVLQLFHAFGQANKGDALSLIMRSTKSPFLEERIGACDVIRAMSMRGVGLRLLLLHKNETDSSFTHWLLNENETTPEGKKAKHTIVSSMLENNGTIIGGLLTANVLHELEVWRRRGPHYTTAHIMEMATE